MTYTLHLRVKDAGRVHNYQIVNFRYSRNVHEPSIYVFIVQLDRELKYFKLNCGFVYATVYNLSNYVYAFHINFDNDLLIRDYTMCSFAVKRESKDSPTVVFSVDGLAPIDLCEFMVTMNSFILSDNVCGSDDFDVRLNDVLFTGDSYLLFALCGVIFDIKRNVLQVRRDGSLREPFFKFSFH